MEINNNVTAGLETNHVIDLSDRLYKIMMAIIGLVAIYIVGQMLYDFKALPQNFPREITVNGEGKAYAKPDVAMVELGVKTQAPKSQDAVNANNTKMVAVVEAIKALGIEDKDIQTTSYSLNPVYGSEMILPAPSPDGVSAMYPYPRSTEKIVAYSVYQQVSVKIRDFDKTNSVLDVATTKGANLVGSLQFTIDDVEKVRAEAREKAIAQAKEKAGTLASQSGLHLDKLVNVSEGYGGYPTPYYGYGMGGAGLDVKEASVAPQIQPGQQEITTTVMLTYRVR